MKTKVEVKCSLRTGMVDRRLLIPIQGNLKELNQDSYDKLKRSIYKEGFRFPVFVWENPEGKIFTFDGHSRLFVLQKMSTEGYEVPDVIPVLYIEADNIEHAKALLLRFNSNHGKITEEGLYEFQATLKEINKDDLLEDVELPGIDMQEFKDGWLQDPIEELNTENQPPEGVKIELTVHNEDYPLYLRKLGELNKGFPRTRIKQESE